MIDRKKVLSGLECHRNGFCFACPYNDDVIETTNCKRQLVEDAIELLKSQPEQKPGHWKGFTQSRYFGTDDDGEPIFRDGVFYVCSECRRKSIIKHPYCPRCGAKMDEENEKEK